MLDLEQSDDVLGELSGVSVPADCVDLSSTGSKHLKPNSSHRTFGQRLAAIMMADVSGYSRLMEADEVGTVRAINSSFRDIIAPKVNSNHGTIIRTMGDGMLAEFPRAVDALAASIEVQEAMADRNAFVPKNRRIEFRIGLNVGNVVVDQGELQGTGINVSARLESLAEPGGVWLSKSVYKQVCDSVDLEFISQGEIQLKNIDVPVGVFSLPPSCFDQNAARKTVVSSEGAISLTRPSIVVLPIQNFNQDPNLHQFCDALTEGITYNLSRFREILVIARQSSASLRNGTTTPQELGQKLGVRYVLESGLMANGPGVRIIVKLLDVGDGRHLWSNQYERDTRDLFPVLDEISQVIGAAIPIRLERAEDARLRLVDEVNLDAYGFLRRGNRLTQQRNKIANQEALRCFEKAIEIEPDYARAHAAMARLYGTQHQYSWTDEPDEAQEIAVEYANKAIDLDPDDARGYAELGFARLWRKEVDLAIPQYERALALNPNDPDILAEFADAYVFAGKPEESLELLKVAERLNPYLPDDYRWLAAGAYYSLREYDRVIDEAMQMRDPSEAHRLVAASHAQLGQNDAAKRHAEAAVRTHPEFSVGKWSDTQPDTDDSEIEHLTDGLLKAGLPK